MKLIELFKINVEVMLEADNPGLTQTTINEYQAAIDALEKQEAKKPIKIYPFHYSNLFNYICPNCGEMLEVPGCYPKCCEDCGQKIDWVDAREEIRGGAK